MKGELSSGTRFMFVMLCGDTILLINRGFCYILVLVENSMQISFMMTNNRSDIYGGERLILWEWDFYSLRKDKIWKKSDELNEFCLILV